MTQDEIIEMARECSLIGMRPHLDGIYAEALEAFAKLVAQAEREDCAKVCEQEQEYWGWDKVFDAAKLIRARGET